MEESEEENFLVVEPISQKNIAEQSDEGHSPVAEANFQGKSIVCNTCEENVRLGISQSSHTPKLVSLLHLLYHNNY